MFSRNILSMQPAMYPVDCITFTSVEYERIVPKSPNLTALVPLSHLEPRNMNWMTPGKYNNKDGYSLDG